MLRVGITGAIGAGKSTVSARLAELGADVVDYDLLAREVVRPGSPGLKQICDRFGPEVIRADGTLDRSALGATVFDDSTARADLEEITHPAIRELAAVREGEAGPDAVVVHDNPLLIEMGQATQCDVVVVVDVTEETQLARLGADRGMSIDAAKKRMAAQSSRQQRVAAADVVLANDGSPRELYAQVDALWSALRDSM